MTISQGLEYKEWNYVTGDIVKQYMIDLGGIGDDPDSASQNSDSDNEDQSSGSDESSDDAMNPQGDESVGAQGAGPSAGAGSRRGRKARGKATTTQPESKPKNLVACHVSTQGFAYLAIDNNKIIVYNLVTKEVQSIFESYQSKCPRFFHQTLNIAHDCFSRPNRDLPAVHRD